MKYQKGFAHAFLIIGFLAVLMGALGFVFWHNFLNPQDDTKAKVGERYTNLTDWGVRFKNVARLNDTKVISTHMMKDQTEEYQYYAITTQRIKNIGGRCSEQAFGETIRLERNKVRPEVYSNDELISDTPIDGYYYLIAWPAIYCTSFGKDQKAHKPSTVEVDDSQSLKASLRGLEVSK